MTERIRILLVDDEALARQRLRALLAAHAEVEVVAEAGRLAEARQELSRTRVDLVLLDINLFGEDGFDLLPDLPAGTRVIFVSAHDEYAIKAFECQAIDYLLKPVAAERLARSLARVRPPAPDRPATGAGPAADDRIPLRDRGRIFLVPPAEIVAILAEREYTRVISETFPPILQRKAMQQWEKELSAEHFVRVHRMALVNLSYVNRLEEADSHLLLHLHGYPQPIPVSSRLAARLKGRFSPRA